MNFVEPIRDRKKIAQIKNQLRGQHRYRDLLLFVVGINTALRISDLLELRAEHFLDDQQLIRQRFWIKEQKRGKRQEVVINDSIREALEEYLTAYPEIISDHLLLIGRIVGTDGSDAVLTSNRRAAVDGDAFGRVHVDASGARAG